MSPRQRIEIRQSEIRERINSLLNLETRDDDQRAELKTLTAEAQTVEIELRAALVAEPEPKTTTGTHGDAEDREKLQLRSKFSIGRVIAATIKGSQVTGAEAEYAAAVGLNAGQVPVDVFERRDAAPERETRAATPGVQGGTMQRPIVPALFDRSVASFLGVRMESAGVGDVAFPVLATSVTAGVEEKGAPAPETAGSFTVSSVEPRRLTGSFRVQYEDLARLEGMEEALRMNLSMVMGDTLDDHVLNGDAASGDGKVRGLLPQLGDPSAPASGAETWERFHAALVSHIDGLHATDEMGVKALIGAETFRHCASQFRTNETSESATAYFNRVFGGVRATRRIAAPASGIQQAVVVRNNPANDSAAVMAHWSGFDIHVRDIYTGAGRGEVAVTAIALVSNVVILRSGVYVRDSFRLGTG